MIGFIIGLFVGALLGDEIEKMENEQTDDKEDS